MLTLSNQQTIDKSSFAFKAVLMGVIVLVVDQLTKFLTYQYIPLMDRSSYWYPYGGVGIFKNFLGIEFSISHMTNKGAAWGAFGEYQVLLVVLRIALIIGLLGYAYSLKNKGRWLVPLSLIIAGAIGNVVDFFVYGHVVDMLHVVLWGYDFPVFNIADSAISIGIVLWFILSLCDQE